MKKIKKALLRFFKNGQRISVPILKEIKIEVSEKFGEGDIQKREKQRFENNPFKFLKMIKT